MGERERCRERDICRERDVKRESESESERNKEVHIRKREKFLCPRTLSLSRESFIDEFSLAERTLPFVFSQMAQIRKPGTLPASFR